MNWDAAILLQKGQSVISARLMEQPVSFRQEVAIRLLDRGARDEYLLVLESLQSMNEHWPVRLLENVLPDLDYQVRPYAEDMPVKSRMMERAERKPVGHDRFPTFMRVGQDVGRFEEFVVPESANSTVFPIGGQDPFAKRLLMHPPAHESCDVGPPCLAVIRLGQHNPSASEALIIESD